MSKRKLTKQQSKRIKQQQQDILDTSAENSSGTPGLSGTPTLSGLVVSHHGTQIDLETTGETQHSGRVRCHVRANLDSVVTGDEVRWQNEGDMGVVVSIEKRRSTLVRPDSYGKLRPVAANLSQLVIVISPQPEAHGGLIDRYLVVAENMGVNALILINKADALEHVENDHLARLKKIYSGIGYQVISISAHTGFGFDLLESSLNNQTSIFVGQSGVGKSSILQKLLPEEEIRIGALSQARTKGKHTTTHTRLYHFSSGGNCIDSPGIREFGLWHMNETDIMRGFVDLHDIGQSCRFNNCKHESEPGCNIKSALEQGLLYKERFDSYKHILNTLGDVTIKEQRNR